MALPVINITRQDNPPPRASATDTGLAYVNVIAERGPSDEAVEVRNLQQFVDSFGDRQTYSGAYDWVETFFREGGARALVARRVGPSPVLASKAISDGSGTAVTVRAREYGAHANTWTIAVAVSAGSATYTLTGTDGNGDAFTEVVGPYATVADAIAADPFVRATFVLGTGVDPVTTGATALLGGTDDHANITQTQINTARALFSPQFGPGQYVDVDVTTTATHSAMMADADLTGRLALLDYADTATAATIETALATDRADANSESGAAYVNWLTIPPVSGAVNERTVPPSALVAAVMARNDGAGLSPNEPPSGKNGRGRWVTGLTQAAWSLADETALAAAGGNSIRDRLSTGVTIWGARTVADPDDTRWTWVSNVRLYGAIFAQANSIADEYVAGRLNERVLASGQSALSGLLLSYYPEDIVPRLGFTGSADAFNVSTAENTADTMEAGEAIWTLSFRMAGVAETISIRLVKVSQLEAVA